MIKNKTSILIIVILFLQSCNILNSENSKIDPIEGKIIFEVIETNNSQISEIPKIIISLSTKKIYNCSNYLIKADKKEYNDIIDIELTGIIKPDICFTECGPAGQRFELNNLEGKYTINFNYYNFKDKYNLYVSDSFIELKGDSTNNTKPKTCLFWRYPENSFVYLCGTTIEDSTIYTKFIDTLLSEIDLEEIFFPDSGALPYPCKPQGHQYDHPAKYFYYKNDSDYIRIETILKKFKEDHFIDKTGIGISFIYWRNERIRSWSL